MDRTQGSGRSAAHRTSRARVGRRGRRFGSLVAALALVVTAACGGDDGSTASGAEENGEETDPTTSEAGGFDTEASLTAAIIGSPEQFDPVQSDSLINDYAYLTPIYDRLIELKSDRTLAPMLATSWELADDAMSMDLELREGVTFHDGSDFDASVVVANLERVIAAEDSRAHQWLSLVESVEAIDDFTVRIHTNAPGYELPIQLASTVGGSIASGAALEAADGDGALAQDPVGSGPFRFVEVTQDSVVYERFDEYWDDDLLARAPAQLEIVAIADDRTRLNALESGQIDAMTVLNPLPELEDRAEAANLEITRFDGGRTLDLLVNSARPNVSDPVIRQAISHAIDREPIATEFLPGTGATPTAQPFPPGHEAHSSATEEVEQDLEEARRLLDSAGAGEFTLELLIGDNALFSNTAQVVQSQLAEVGITVETVTVPNSESFVEWTSGEYDLFIQALGGTVDPAEKIREFYLGFYNVGDDAPSELTDMFDAATSHRLDSPERIEAFQEISAYMAESPVHITLASSPVLFVTADRIAGMEMNALGPINSGIDPRYLAVEAE